MIDSRSHYQLAQPVGIAEIHGLSSPEVNSHSESQAWMWIADPHAGLAAPNLHSASIAASVDLR